MKQKPIHREAVPQSETWIAEREIDLLPHIQVLFNWWREIGLITFLMMLIAVCLYLGYGTLAEPNYQAVATLAFIRQDSHITLDERFQTLSEEGALEVALIRDARRAALAKLAVNGTVARAVVNELQDLLSEDERKPALLMEQVEAIVPLDQKRIQSDLIELRVITNNPIKSAQIANSWAKHYVAQVNQLYGRSPDELNATLENELVTSFALYQTAQAELESFIGTRQVAMLERQLDEKENVVRLLQINKASIVQQRLQSQARILKQLYVESERIRTYLGRAEHLKTEFESANGGANEGSVATNSVALLLLKAQIYAAPFDPPESLQVSQQAGLSLAQPLPQIPSSPSLPPPSSLSPPLVSQFLIQPQVVVPSLSSQTMDPLQLNIDSTFLGQTTAMDQAADVATLVKGLQLRQDALTEEIQTLSSEFRQENIYQPTSTEDDVPLGQTFDQLDLEILQLQAKIEAENAQHRQLSLQRDLGWDAYQTLSRKAVELSLDSATPNSEVRFAASAIPPAERLPIASLLLSLPLVLLAGLMIGIFVAFISTYLGRQPFLSQPR